MAKLYPPQIEGTIAAFSGNRLSIPFNMNKTVSWNEIDGFYLKIKSIQTNDVIDILESKEYDKQNLVVQFNIPENTYNSLSVGMSYKVQLAYYQGNETGYYSTVGVIKYTSDPTITIEGLESGQLHVNQNNYIGKYSQLDGDTTEKVYSYNFTIYNSDGSIFETSGEKIHNHENDDEIYESTDSYLINKTLEENKVYTIQYTCTTTSNMVVPSPRYRIVQASTIAPEILADVTAEMNQENGYVKIELIGHKDETGGEISAIGAYVLSRASSADNFKNWTEVARFAFFGEYPSTYSYRDFTVEHGYDYQYSLQQYNKEYQIYSDRILSNIITAAFEHSFLFDGERQLKIKFNPQVSSFKETLLESKTNTIGGKYPYFYRNGNVAYKEFPISGLISYQSDEEELFMTNEEMFLDDNSIFAREHTLKPNITSSNFDYFNNMEDANYAYVLQDEYKRRERPNSQENRIASGKFRTTQLTDYNIVAERNFKMRVLEFLNSARPMLFRSPEEGNYLVRLMNSSLAPNTQLSRMLHTFSTTASEIDSHDYLTLGNYGLTKITEPDTTQLRWKTYMVQDVLKNGISTDNWRSIGENHNIYSLRCEGMVPGDRLKISFASGSNAVDTETEIRIGMTGAYSVEFDVPPSKVEISQDVFPQGQITISYKAESMQTFDTYRKIAAADIPARQFIGGDGITDVRDQLEDIKFKVTKYYFANFTKRPVVKITKDGNSWKWNDEIIDPNDLDPLTIYLYTDADNKDIYCDGQIGLTDSGIDYQNKIYIDDKEIDITETCDYQLIRPEGIPKIVLTSGVVADIGIQRREVEYDVETERNNIIENDYNIIESKQNYLDAVEKIKQLILGIDENGVEIDDGYYNIETNDKYQEELNNAINTMNNKYQIFISDVQQRLKDKGVVIE